MFTHVHEDCEKFQEEGICYDKACQKRHRKKCRYDRDGICFRGDKCEYIHKKQKQIRNNTEGKQPIPENVCHNCDYCDFKCRNKVTMNKHVYSKHGDKSGLRNKNENQNQFITWLGLEKYSSQYQD